MRMNRCKRSHGPDDRIKQMTETKEETELNTNMMELNMKEMEMVNGGGKDFFTDRMDGRRIFLYESGHN